MNIINKVAAIWSAKTDMELLEQIQQLQQLDEMKNDTRWIKDILRILFEDATKKSYLEHLLENIGYPTMECCTMWEKGNQTPWKL